MKLVIQITSDVDDQDKGQDLYTDIREHLKSIEGLSVKGSVIENHVMLDDT